MARGVPRDGINFFAVFGLSRTVEGHLRVGKQSPGTFEVIIILLVLQQSGASTEEAGEQMTTGTELQQYHLASCPRPRPRPHHRRGKPLS